MSCGGCRCLTKETSAVATCFRINLFGGSDDVHCARREPHHCPDHQPPGARTSDQVNNETQRRSDKYAREELRSVSHPEGPCRSRLILCLVSVGFALRINTLLQGLEVGFGWVAQSIVFTRLINRHTYERGPPIGARKLASRPAQVKQWCGCGKFLKLNVYSAIRPRPAVPR